MLNALHAWINRAWYGHPRFWRLTTPLSWLVALLVTRRRAQFIASAKTSYQAPLPVIVVGNITVGGTGKTPLVIWLVEQLQAQGLRPGIVSRGYGGKAPHYPYVLQPEDSPEITGDEPLMLLQRTGVPVVIDPDRVAAVQAIAAQTDCNVVISDDGLQHYQMARTYEIVVLDGSRGIGNQHVIPTGPLREPADRLRGIDAVVVNGTITHPSFSALSLQHPFSMQIKAADFRTLQEQQPVKLHIIQQLEQPLAVAGIGNPQRFFSTLRDLGVQCESRAFPDHYPYTQQDFATSGTRTILTTEKDAVKLRRISGVHGYYLAVDAELQAGLIDDIMAALERFNATRRHLY